jgi:hypothetical protein
MRFGKGFVEMFTVSYVRLWYFKVVAMYVLFAAALVVAGRRHIAALVLTEPAVFAFLVLLCGGLHGRRVVLSAAVGGVRRLLTGHM